MKKKGEKKGMSLFKMRMPKKGEKGFTLIELLIVVGILGILAAVIIPNIGRFIESSEDKAYKTERETVETAVGGMMSDLNMGTIPNPVNYDKNGDGSFNQADVDLFVDQDWRDYGSNDMSAFPDYLSDNTALAGATHAPVTDNAKVLDSAGNSFDFVSGDKAGFVLWNNDELAWDGVTVSNNDIFENYISGNRVTTTWYYMCDVNGTIYQSPQSVQS